MVSSGEEELRLATPAPGLLSLSCSGMESVVQPSVFVVDGQTGIPFRRLGQNHRRQHCGTVQVSLALLLLLLGAGLATQGWFLLRLHQRLGDIVAHLPVSGAWGTSGASPIPVSVWLCIVCQAESPSRIQGFSCQPVSLTLSLLICTWGSDTAASLRVTYTVVVSGPSPCPPLA